MRNRYYAKFGVSYATNMYCLILYRSYIFVTDIYKSKNENINYESFFKDYNPHFEVI